MCATSAGGSSQLIPPHAINPPLPNSAEPEEPQIPSGIRSATPGTIRPTLTSASQANPLLKASDRIDATSKDVPPPVQYASNSTTPKTPPGPSSSDPQGVNKGVKGAYKIWKNVEKDEPKEDPTKNITAHLAKVLDIPEKYLKNPEPEALDAALGVANYRNLDEDQKRKVRSQVWNLRSRGNSELARQLFGVIGDLNDYPQGRPYLQTDEQLKKDQETNRLMAGLVDKIPAFNTLQYILLKSIVELHSKAANSREKILHERQNSLPW